MADSIEEALADVGLHERRLYADNLAWTAENLEPLRRVQDPPPRPPETTEEAVALFERLVATLAREGALQLGAFAAAAADGRSERAQAVLKRVLYRSVVRKAGGPEPAGQEAYLRFEEAAEPILCANGAWRGRSSAFAYLGRLERLEAVSFRR